jgi:hypothetical protein
MLTPLVLIGPAHFAISAGTSLARYSGILSSGQATRSPRSAKRWRTAGVSKTSLVARASRSTIVEGVPFNVVRAWAEDSETIGHPDYADQDYTHNTME